METRRIESMIPAGTKTLLILGHIRPDGDATGSTLGLYHYLKEVRPEISVTVCLEPFSKAFYCLKDADKVIPMEEMDKTLVFDTVISCDASDTRRLGDALPLYEAAGYRICIDHHITNVGFGDENYIRGGLSSCSEALCELMDLERVTLSAAECLYLGIVHDTGVFKFSSTTRATMEYAGRLMEKGVNTTEIIDGTYYGRSFTQTILLAKGLSKMKAAADGKITYTCVTMEDMALCGAGIIDTNGIVDELRNVTGVEAAIFVYEMAEGKYKFSLRANRDVDVARVAVLYGGGGHVKAAGFEACGDYDQLMEEVLEQISAQL